MTLHSSKPGLSRIAALFAAYLAPVGLCFGQPYLDNETLYSNQDPNTETRRSEHFRLCFGHFNRDTGTPMTEQLAQGNLRMYEQMWNRWVLEMGLHDINESVSKPDGKKYRANFNFLMTWNDGGGGGAYSSMDGNGFFYAMANSGYCRFDPPSGATPHEFGHVWEGSCAGFNGSDSSGAWWECTANWMQLQFLNTYPQAGAYLYNGVYYPAHGRDYYDSFTIWETALEDPRYGAAWVNNVWTNANPEQRKSEYILDRMIRCDTSGSPDKAGAMKDLWGDMTKKMLTWDFARQRWLATANRPDDGSNWEFYQRARTPLVKVPGHPGRYRPARAHLPMEFGFNFIPLAVTNGTTVSCVFEPQCDPVRQSDWRACLVAVNSAGEASYSSLWSVGTNSLPLSADQAKCYLAVIATPKPMKIADPAWQAYLTDAGLQFPYTVSFLNAAPRNVVYSRPTSGVSWKTFTNADGSRCTNVASGAVIDATAYVSPTAMVLGSAQVRGNTRIEDFAVVKDSVRITNAVISGHALVEGNARVYGNAKVRDWAHVFGYAEVFENAKVIEHANCGDGNATTHTKVYGSAVVKGTTYVYDTSTLNGCLIMEGDSANGNGTTPSSKGVHFGWGWGQDTARFNALPDNGWVYAQHTFEKDNPVFAMDEFGINHGFLMNRCLAEPDSGTDVRGGRVLPLNGANQYIELHNSLNDFKECAVAVWLKWAGGPPGQRVWSMGDGGQKIMCLVANDTETGGLRFIMADGTTSWTLDGAPLSPDTWTHAAIVFSGTTCTLYVNGAPVASNAAVTLFPQDLNAPLMENANFLGRGNAGDYFAGSLDDFRVYMKTLDAEEIAAIYSAPPPAPVIKLEDNTPPAPQIPTWLVAPRPSAADAVTMSATPGADDSGWVEYYFACVSGSGHDSGWVSFNKYTDVGLPSGQAVTYTVQMRDRAGNTTVAGVSGTTTPAASPLPPAGFAYGPLGIANGQITMTATKPAGLPTKTEYKFDCVTAPVASSGWQSSPSWTHTGLTTGTSYAYTVTVRDGVGNVSAASAAVSAVARDDAPPRLPMRFAHWEMLPYATIDNRISMTAMAPADAGSVEYQFHCLSGGAPDSAWQTSRTFVTPVLPDGTYVYQYRVRDTSPQRNTSEYSSSYPSTIDPTTGYHSYFLEQLGGFPDDTLVSFSGTVMKVNTHNYYVKDTVSGEAIKVRPSTSNETTTASLALKQVLVKGHLYTFSGAKEVTFATLTATGDPVVYAVTGRVTNAFGAGIAGATVYFADLPGAVTNVIVTATTDATGSYSRSLTPGRWYVAATAAAYNNSPEREFTIASAPIAGIDLGLRANARVSGKVLRRADGSPVGGATVYFSRSPGASAAPLFTTATDLQGNFTQPLQDGTWYAAAGGAGYFTSADKTLFIAAVDIPAIDFALQSSVRNIPAATNLLFAALTESLPASGATGPWPTLYPQGKTLATLGSPSVEMLDGVKWEKNLYADADGFNQARYASALPCNGVTIVAAVRPIYTAVGGEPRGEVVDIFYDRLALAVSHTDGRVMVARNYWNDWGPALANGRKVILSLVVQVNGSYKVYANGAQIMSGVANGNWTSINPDHSSTWGNDPDFTHYVSVGRNAPDGWSTFNGNIGDVFVYTNALPDSDRVALEADLTAKFLSVDYTVAVSAGAGGYVNPLGTVPVNPGGSQTFTITPLAGYAVANVVADGISKGVTGSWTFANVTANHTLTVLFAPTLMIRPDGTGTIDLTWPETYPGQLIASPAIGPGAVWTPVSVPPTLANGFKKVTVTPVETTFYGLGW
jgi:carbonic anhydrase/acetyltransferase-like protein (isoleucine patch superfamily)